MGDDVMAGRADWILPVGTRIRLFALEFKRTLLLDLKPPGSSFNSPQAVFVDTSAARQARAQRVRQRQLVVRRDIIRIHRLHECANDGTGIKLAATLRREGHRGTAQKNSGELST